MSSPRKNTPVMPLRKEVSKEKKLDEEFYDGTIQIAESKTRVEKDTGKKYTTFVITVKLSCGLSWTVEHRYNDFYKLNQTLKKQLKKISELHFPKKIWFGNLARATVESRRKTLEAYLCALMNFQPRPVDLHGFLEFEEHTKTLDRNSGKVTVEDFELLKVVGKGSFGKVFLVRFLRNGNIYAMKVRILCIFQWYRIRSYAPHTQTTGTSQDYGEETKAGRTYQSREKDYGSYKLSICSEIALRLSDCHELVRRGGDFRISHNSI